jgi:hypothetical protein
VVRFVLPSQVTSQSRTYNYSVVFGSECLQKFVLACNSRVRFPVGAWNFSFHRGVQSGSGAHSASYPMGTRGTLPAGKATRA